VRMGEPGRGLGLRTKPATERRVGARRRAGRDYADVVSAVWPHADRPLDGAAGIGPQLARLAELARGATTQVAAGTAERWAA
ncbi:hypothetical protein, partial [Actinoplanes philippinensis]|uniref:hypothetical protein n=1 Tax=Actinoplanes philippinensis TaxID=35752 RepID=UPI0033EA6FCD